MLAFSGKTPAPQSVDTRTTPVSITTPNNFARSLFRTYTYVKTTYRTARRPPSRGGCRLDRGGSMPRGQRVEHEVLVFRLHFAQPGQIDECTRRFFGDRHVTPSGP